MPQDIDFVDLSQFFDNPSSYQSRPNKKPTKAQARQLRNAERDAKRYANIPKRVQPRNEAQREYIEALKESDFVIATGGAGTGKTTVAARIGLEYILDGKLDRLIITRPMVGVSGEEIGFLPGDIKEKTLPWSIPIIDALKEALGKDSLERMIKQEKVEFVPFQFIRGRTFNNAFMVLDEAQNTTIEQIKVFTTRVGQNSRVVVNGDLQQSDLKGRNGLKYLIDVADRTDVECEIFEFTDADIVRSKICSQWVNAFKEYEDIYA
jgi:phosphate starvation-inducible PhoH-like protein